MTNQYALASQIIVNACIISNYSCRKRPLCCTYKKPNNKNFTPKNLNDGDMLNMYRADGNSRRRKWEHVACNDDFFSPQN